MNFYIFIAGCLALIMGLIHSVLGEILIFKNWRKENYIPTINSPVLRTRHARILWASWHVLTLFGWGIGLTLIELSYKSTTSEFHIFFLEIIRYLMLASSIFVGYGTKGKHPGWIGFLIIAILLWLS